MQEQSRRKLQEMILQDKLDEAKAYCIQLGENSTADKELAIYNLFFLIREEELKNKEICIFEFSRDLKILERHYHILKFLIRRIEFDWIPTDSMELVRYCTENCVSISALVMIIHFSTRHPNQTMEKVKQLFWEYQKNIELVGSGGAVCE